MAREDLTYKVAVDASDAVGGLRKLEGAVRSTMREVEDELDSSATAGDKFSASIDRLSAQMREDFNSAAIAAEELQRALRDAGSSLEVGDAIAELNRMGISFDEITADSDKFAASLKQLDDVRLQGVKDLDGVAPGLATKLDGVAKSADSSRSVLANMVGNATQDLGALGGIAGSAGVAIGQMGEYMVDATNSGDKLGDVMKNFAGVAAPIAGLALATQLITDVMGRFSDSSKRSADSVDAWADAMSSGGDAADNYAASLADTGEVTLDLTASQSKLQNIAGSIDSTFRGLVPQWKLFADVVGATDDETKDMTATLADAGITVDTWAKAIEGGATGVAALEAIMSKNGTTSEDQALILETLAQQQDAHAKATESDTVANKFFGESSEEKNKRLDEEQKALDDAKAAQDEHRQAVEEATQAAKDQAIALDDANGQMLDLSSTFAEMVRRSDAISTVFDLGNAPLDAAAATRDIAEAIGGLAEAADGVKVGDILAGNVKGDAVLDALDGLRPQIQAKIAEAFAAGGPEAAVAVADDYVGQIVKSLGGKLTAEQVKELLGLDDLEATINVALDESTAARVRTQLDILTGVSGQTPLTASIALALEAGTLSSEAAEVLARSMLGQAHVTLPTDVTPPTPEQIAEAGAFVAAQSAQDPAELATSVDSSGAERGVDGFRAGVESDTPAEVPLDADSGGAEDTRDDFVDETERTSPIIDIRGETQAALGLLVALKIFAALLSPEVVVTANTSSARSSLATLAGTTTRVPVDAYLADYPTASEIAARIGRPRIPVDIVVGSTIRITGVRE